VKEIVLEKGFWSRTPTDDHWLELEKPRLAVCETGL
jgi:hypothetical protein